MVKESKDFGCFGSQDPFSFDREPALLKKRRKEEMLVQFIIAGSLLGFWVYDTTRKRKEEKEK